MPPLKPFLIPVSIVNPNNGPGISAPENPIANDDNAVNINTLDWEYYFTEKIIAPLTWFDVSSEWDYTTTWENMWYSWEDSLWYVKTVSLIEAWKWSIWWAEIWWTWIWWLKSDYENIFKYFDRAVDHWNLYERWKRIKRVIKESSVSSNFFLDTYVVLAEVTGDIELSDKF
jgi:hypothetical protein